jgi:23S rRNA (uracil1939-C5)-methyltransferase
MSEEITVEITALGNSVGGISSGQNRKTVFVRGALPGETVRCRISREKKGWFEADPLEILQTSQYRIKPFCSYFGDCGGCSLQNLDYSRQLFWKREWIKKALSRANIQYSPELMNDVIPSPLINGYRNRVSFDIVSGRPGLHRFRGDIMAIDNCPLLNGTGQKAFGKLSEEQLDGYGRVSVRASNRTGEAMIEFTGSPATELSFADNSYITAWKDKGKWNADPSGYVLHETLGEFTYPIKPGTFFQVNTGSAEKIVSVVINVCGENNRILDLYGGCGTFALPLAAMGAEVTSVELNADSSASGNDAAEHFGVKGVHFVTGRTRHYLLDTVKSKQTWDTVIVDPPRGGLGIRVSRLLRRVISEKIIYVSCNPYSFARDLRIICDGGWAVAGLQPVDMFPQTDHVETVVELKRKENQ